MLPISVLKNRYQTLANLFIDEINNTNVLFYYENQVTPSSPTNSFDQEPSNMDIYGQRLPLAGIEDRFEETGTQHLFIPQTKSITARAYWNPKNYAKDGVVAQDQDVCKIICHDTYWNDILSASYIEVHGRKLKRFQGPIKFGLFEKVYVMSYWVTI